MPLEGPASWLWAEGLPAEVAGLMSTRRGGVSQPPFDALNLRPSGLRGDTTDEPAAVLENQRRFAGAMEGARPVYLNQVHGIRVVRLGVQDATPAPAFPEADASITLEPGVACTVLVADCLPVLFAAPGGSGVGAAHAGWRGLAGGVLEATVAALSEAAGCAPGALHAWLGACIGPAHFEVGRDVREAFGAAGEPFFAPRVGAHGAVPDKWLADLPGLAKLRLRTAGLHHVAGGGACTFSDASRFFSYRRDGVTGRQAAAVWIRQS